MVLFVFAKNSISAKIFIFRQKQIRSVQLEFFVPAKCKSVLLRPVEM
jgi:hypothetical protein